MTYVTIRGRWNNKRGRSKVIVKKQQGECRNEFILIVFLFGFLYSQCRDDERTVRWEYPSIYPSIYSCISKKDSNSWVSKNSSNEIYWMWWFSWWQNMRQLINDTWTQTKQAWASIFTMLHLSYCSVFPKSRTQNRTFVFCCLSSQLPTVSAQSPLPRGWGKSATSPVCSGRWRSVERDSRRTWLT